MSVWLRFEGYWFEIPPSTYVLNMTISGYEGYCPLGLVSYDGGDSVILGNIFLQDYYSIYDMDNS
jgi:hypothetical protein